MINGPMVGGFMIAAVLVFGAMFAGTWFQSAVAFSDAHSLDAARVSKPFVCSFNTDEFGSKTTGTIHSRGGYMLFDVHENKDDILSEWGLEIDINDPVHMMSQAGPGEPFVKLDDYPDLRVQVIEDLKKIVQSDKLHCAPWWSGNSYRFQLEGHI